MRTSASLVMLLDSLPDTIDDIALARQTIIQNFTDNDYFNDKLQAVGSILTMGHFEKQHLVTAPIDPLMVSYGDLSKEESKKILKIEDEILYPTNIVSAGISTFYGLDIKKGSKMFLILNFSMLLNLHA